MPLVYGDVPLHPCALAPLHPCAPAPLRPCTPAPLHSCALAPLRPCTPAPLHPCAPAPLHPCTPAPPLHSCIAPSYPLIPQYTQICTLCAPTSLHLGALRHICRHRRNPLHRRVCHDLTAAWLDAFAQGRERLQSTRRQLPACCSRRRQGDDAHVSARHLIARLRECHIFYRNSTTPRPSCAS